MSERSSRLGDTRPLPRILAKVVRVALGVRTTVHCLEPLFRIAALRQSGATTLQAANGVLVVRLDDIGDVVLFSGFLRELRTICPHAHITLVVSTRVFNLVQMCPFVDVVLGHECPHQVDLSGGDEMMTRRIAQHWRALVFALRYLCRERPDVAVVPRYEVDRYYASYLAYFSGARVRLGYSTSCTELKRRFTPGYDQLFTKVFTSTAKMHEAERNSEFLRQAATVEVDASRSEIWLGPKDYAFADEFITASKLREVDAIVAFGIGAALDVRRWPLHRVISACRYILECGLGVILIGGHTDQASAQATMSECPGVVSAAGRCTLRQTAALLKKCCLFVGNDSGPMHIAAASGVPVVEISSFPATGAHDHYMSPVRFGPHGVPNKILQPRTPTPPCIGHCECPEAHCILQIQLADVTAAIDEFRMSGTWLTSDGRQPHLIEPSLV